MPPDLNWAPVNEQPQVRYASIGSGNFATMLAVMVLVVVLSSIGASKGVVIGPVITDGAFFLFPLAYILGDMINWAKAGNVPVPQLGLAYSHLQAYERRREA